MKRTIILLGFFVGNFAFSSSSMRGLGFEAPTISATSSVTNPVTGEMVFDDTNNLFKGYNGSSWDTLTVNSGQSAHATVGTAQTILGDDTVTLVNFTSERVDTDGRFDLSADKYTAGFAGVYSVCGHFYFTGSSAWTAGEHAVLQLYKNGSSSDELARVEIPVTPTVSWGLEGGGCTLIDLAATDYLEFKINQNSGSSIDLVANSARNYVSIHRVGE